jgi:hypothetical protein
MASIAASGREVSCRVLEHLLQRIDSTPALDEPFSHIYLENVFPEDIYDLVLEHLPDPTLYHSAAERHYGDGNGAYVRWMFKLTPDKVKTLNEEQQDLWNGIAAALTAPELKRAMFTKLSCDLAYRFSVPAEQVGDLPGYSRPTLYRETAGFEIPPHPDTRKKVVTMHLYLPAGRNQLNLGTGLYRRKLMGWPFGGWRHRFEKVKQFAFQPNSGYAFVVTNTLRRKSWHGREQLPPDAGVRNTLLNTFYESPRDDFRGYLPG